MNEYKNRIQSVIAQLPEEADGALVMSQVNRLYLTGYDADTGFLLITRGGCAFVTDFRYIEAANAALDGVCEAVVYSKLGDTLPSLCDKFGAKALLTERERITVAQSAQISEALLPCRAIVSETLDDILMSMRTTKTIAELELVRAAQAITEQSFRHILTCVKEGVSERDLALELEFHMRRSGAQRVAFDLIVAAGPNGSMPHAVPSDYRIKKGDFITFDIGAVVGGYHSDMTRTVSLGEVSEDKLKVYETVRAAQRAGIEYLMSGGTDAFSADKAARDVIEKAGYGKCFGHSTGHAVGLEIHETPSLSPSSKSTLSPGCIVTVEPGIYLAGQFGVRIEDMLYITEDSAIDLTNIERELIVL
ncbi:MAG: aminopeptidase P family protein [Clostridia bacterium]|nr:aminopeptidase P family protein [Clostridia bacterium]